MENIAKTNFNSTEIQALTEKKKCNFIVSNNNQGYFNIPSFGFLQIACIKESPQIKSLFFSIKEIENPVYQLMVQKNSLLNVKFR